MDASLRSGLEAMPATASSFCAGAFAPLLGYRSVKSGSQLLAGAAAVVQRIAWCLVHAREIEIASTQHKHLSDIAGAPAP